MRSALKYLLNSESAGIPLELFLILTDECNYRCRVCSLWRGLYKESNNNQMSVDEIKTLIDQASSLGIPAMIISGGEPLLHPDIVEITGYAVKKIESVRLNTNASLLNDDIAASFVGLGLDEIWISLDGVGKYFDEFRGVEDAYTRSAAGLKNIRAARERHGGTKPAILIDTIVTAGNIAALPEYTKVFTELGADELNFVHACYVPPEAVGETEIILGRKGVYSGQFTTEAGKAAAGCRLSEETISKIKSAAGGKLSFYIDPLLTARHGQIRPPCRCLFPWTNIMIFSGGDACVCPLLDYVTIGNVRRQGIMEMWNGETMREIRRMAKINLPICGHCICTRRTPMDHLRHRQTLQRMLGLK
jgi:MoaA/NifB/PqqE/SkfB family radical SAM enzyme